MLAGYTNTEIILIAAVVVILVITFGFWYWQARTRPGKPQGPDREPVLSNNPFNGFVIRLPEAIRHSDPGGSRGNRQFKAERQGTSGNRIYDPEFDAPTAVDPHLSRVHHRPIVRLEEIRHIDSLVVVCAAYFPHGHSGSPSDHHSDKATVMIQLCQALVNQALADGLTVGLIGFDRKGQLIYGSLGSTADELMTTADQLSHYSKPDQQQLLMAVLDEVRRNCKGCLIVSDFLTDDFSQRALSRFDRYQTVIGFEVVSGLDINIDDLPTGTLVQFNQEPGSRLSDVDKIIWRDKCRKRRQQLVRHCHQSECHLISLDLRRDKIGTDLARALKTLAESWR